MPTNNTTLYFGITGGIAALILGYLAIGFHLKYLPPVLAAIVTIVLFTKKIDSLKPKKRSKAKSIFFGFLIAFSTLFIAALAGSTTLFIMSSLDFFYPDLFNFKMNFFESESTSFEHYFFKEGIKYLLAPLVSVISGGLIPSLLFGLFYGIRKSRVQC